MSNAYAIATATAALRHLLGRAAQAVPGASVTTARPDRLGATSDLRLGVNVYLLGTTPTAMLRNADLPTRSADGIVVHSPPAALNLQYLITFLGDDARLEPQRLMGSSISVLHGSPELSPNLILNAVQASPEMRLDGQDLSAQQARVRLSPMSLTVSELQRLWSAFQVPYRLSMGYTASVVLIDPSSEDERAPSAVES